MLPYLAVPRLMLLPSSAAYVISARVDATWSRRSESRCNEPRRYRFALAENDTFRQTWGSEFCDKRGEASFATRFDPARPRGEPISTDPRLTHCSARHRPPVAGRAYQLRSCDLGLCLSGRV